MFLIYVLLVGSCRLGYFMRCGANKSLTADVVGVMCDMVGTFDVVGCYDLVSLALSIFESCLVMCINIS